MSDFPQELKTNLTTVSTPTLPPAVPRLTVPKSLQNQLRQFRRNLWAAKLIEAVFIATVALLVGFLVVFVVDRFWDTPRSVRLLIAFAAAAAWMIIPWSLHRWVWGHRRMDQLAKLLRQRDPNVGDQLLGVIELAESDAEQARSRALCEAAITQVAEMAAKRDFRQAAPPTRVRSLGVGLVGIACVAGLSVLLAGAAAQNAMARLLTPWRSTPRFTFTVIEPVQSEQIVAHGEPTTLEFLLAPSSQWQPDSATARISGVAAITASRNDTRNDTRKSYAFDLPACTKRTSVQFRIGDYYQTVTLLPTLRPELVAVDAQVHLPEYLQLAESLERDVRGGSLSVIEGSRVTISATATRPLSSAKIDDQPAEIKATEFHGPVNRVAATRADFHAGIQQPNTEMDAITEMETLHELSWQDQLGLAGHEAFGLRIASVRDQPPSVAANGIEKILLKRKVLLQDEQINFQAIASDDFGVKRVGIAWQGLDDPSASGAVGEKIVAVGAPDASSLDFTVAFSASSLEITPQRIELRFWAEDYHPERGRAESVPYSFTILSAEQHAQWILGELENWHRASLEVRDRERGLHKRNQQLRDMDDEQLSAESLRDELRQQAAAEASNARRLSELSQAGETLLGQAARNSEILPDQIQQWAETLAVLNDIAQNRMPSVEDLLKKASAQAGNRRSGKESDEDLPIVGQNHSTPADQNASEASQAKDENSDANDVPSIMDQESSQAAAVQPPASAVDQPQDDEKLPTFGMAMTTVIGPGAAEDPEAERRPGEKELVDTAIEEQTELLEEFKKVAEEMDLIMANLEGGTFVKRLKAASRQQDDMAQKIADRIATLFGHKANVSAENRQWLDRLVKQQAQTINDISYIIDDMESFYERRQLILFRLVLEEMNQTRVQSSLRDLATRIPEDHGIALAQAEYWADTLDRWADDLIIMPKQDEDQDQEDEEPKDPQSLPPSIVLEMLRVLEAEVNLRESTRAAEQAKTAVSEQQYVLEALRLHKSQEQLRTRTESIVSEIAELPDGRVNFETDINLLMSVGGVMNEAASILASPNTGSEAIAAETEVIELMLQSKRVNPKGGGGGSPSSSGGGAGDTEDAALALIGAGLNLNEQLRENAVRTATGESGQALPEEFRAGLDEYFRRLEEER